jgi:putative membrane protein
MTLRATIMPIEVQARSGRQLAALMGGLAALWVAVGSPLAELHHHLLTAHMAQHLLLMTVSAPLILLGIPALRSMSKAIQPVFCWFAGTGVVMAWHVPALFELGLRSAYWHAFEQASFLAAGLLFWLPVIQALRNEPSPAISRWHIPLYLFLATLPCDALSAFLTFCDRVVYPNYASAHRLFDISPLGDQEFAGALMWVWVTFVYLAPAAAITIQLLSPQRDVLDGRAQLRS